MYTIDFLQIIKQVFNALENLHSIGYTHNDIKPENIMIDQAMEVTLIDLGYAKKFMNYKKKFVERQ